MKWPLKRRERLVNYAQTPQVARPIGVSGLPTYDATGDIAEGAFIEGPAALAKGGGVGGGGMWGGIKSLFSGGIPVDDARRAVAGAMALVSPWLSNVVWTINRIFFSLAREAYGGNAVVYAALHLLSTAVAEPPLVPHTIDKDKNREELDWDHPLYKLIRNPNELMTEMSFVEMCVVHMGLVGRCHWWKERDNLGRIVALWPLRPDRVGPLYAVQPVTQYGYQPVTEQLNTPNNLVSGAAKPLKQTNRVLTGWTYWPPGWSTPIRIPREDVMTINLGDPAGETGGVVEGLGPMQVLAREIEADNEATSFVAALLKNHASPGAILHVKTNIDVKKAALFKREFKKTFAGTHRGEIAVFDGDTAFEQIGFNMQELEFPNLRKVSEARICASLGIPVMLVGFYSGLESANRSTLSEFREYFAETTLPPWWRRIQEAYSRDVADEFGDNLVAIFDTSKVRALLVQAARTVQPYADGFKNGVVTNNEYRQNFLGLPPLEGPIGDMLYIPNTVTPTDANSTVFETVGPGVAASYGADSPTPLQDGRVQPNGDKPTTTPRLPGSDKPTPDSSNMGIPAQKVKSVVATGTGVCFSCGGLIDAGAKGFRCTACLQKHGMSEAKYVETYTRIGESGKPWVPQMVWRARRRIYDKTHSSEPVASEATD